MFINYDNWYLPVVYCMYVVYKKSGPENYYEHCTNKDNSLKNGWNCARDLCPLLKKD